MTNRNEIIRKYLNKSINTKEELTECLLAISSKQDSDTKAIVDALVDRFFKWEFIASYQ